MDEVKCLSIDELETGDCILFKGRSIISRLIRLFTEYSHAALVVKPGFRRPANMHTKIYMVEAVAEGVELTSVKRLAGYKGEIHVFRPDSVIHGRKGCIVQEAFDIVSMNIDYDFKSLFANIFGRVSMDARRYFCSEVVWDIWRKCNVVPESLCQRAPRPGDIPKLMKGQLFKLEA